MKRYDHLSELLYHFSESFKYYNIIIILKYNNFENHNTIYIWREFFRHLKLYLNNNHQILQERFYKKPKWISNQLQIRLNRNNQKEDIKLKDRFHKNLLSMLNKDYKI